MIGAANGTPVSITGLGDHVPERVVTNDDFARLVDTSDEWIVDSHRIRERRFAAEDEALSDIALPAARAALEQAGVRAAEIDLLIVATVTPDMQFPSTAAIMADVLGAGTPQPTTSPPAAPGSCTGSRRRSAWSRAGSAAVRSSSGRTCSRS